MLARPCPLSSPASQPRPVLPGLAFPIAFLLTITNFISLSIVFTIGPNSTSSPPTQNLCPHPC